MDTVYKYPIDLNNSEIALPAGAKILDVAFDFGGSGVIYLWARVDTESKTRDRYFEVFGDGQSIPRIPNIEFIYIGTASMEIGLMFHVFERVVSKNI